MNRTIHLYWGNNKPLSWMRFMTVYSLAELNPEWKIKIWITGDPHTQMKWNSGEHSGTSDVGKDWLVYFKHIDNVSFPCIDDIKGIELSQEYSEVHRSDLLRWYIMATEGGLWSDFDIFYMKPLAEELFVSGDKVGLVEMAGRSNHADVKILPIGFLWSGIGQSEFWNAVLTQAKEDIKPCEYQSAGRFALEKIAEGKERHVIPETLVYCYRANETPRLFAHHVLRDAHGCSPIIGYHWYAGHPSSVKASNIAEATNNVFKDSCLIKAMRNMYNEV